VARKFGKTPHHRANLCPPVFIHRMSADLRIDAGYTSLPSVHARRELVFINHALGGTVDQALRSVPHLLALRGGIAGFAYQGRVFVACDICRGNSSATPSALPT
jgi:hypothetical protein